MKLKQLIIVSLVLAIMTIGAVSAADDADTLAVGDDAGDVMSQADDMDVAEQDDGGSGDDPVDERDNVEYDLYNNVDIIPVNDEAAVGIEIKSDEITGNITVKITGDDETEKVINEEIVPYKYNYDDTIDEWVSEGGNYIVLKDLNLNPGKYNVMFSYDGDEKYLPFEESFQFNYCLMYVEIDDEVTDYFTIYASSGLTECIEVFIDNKSYNKINASDFVFDDEDGFGFYEQGVNDLSFGPHTYKITYNGDDYTLSEPLEGEFNYSYVFEVSEAYNVIYGRDTEFSFSHPSTGDGEILITYNGKTVTKKVDYSDYSNVLLNDLNLGENNITFTFKGENYPEKSVNETVYIYAEVAVPYQIRYNNDEDVVSLLLPSDAKGNLLIYVCNGTDEDGYDIWELVRNVTLVDGKANASLSSLGLGQYSLKMEYDGDDYASYFNEDDMYQFSEIVPGFIYDGSIYVKGNNSVKVVLPDDGADNLTVVISKISEEFEEYDPQTIYNEVANGTVTIKLPELEVGNYFFKVQYGNDNANYYYFSVRQNAPEFDMDVTFPSVISDYDWIDIRGVPKDIKNSIYLYVDGKLYDEISAYGDYFYFSKYGNHTWEIRFDGDGYYKKISKNGTFYVDWVEVHENFENGDKIIVLLEDETGFVQLDIDGKYYAVQILEDGWASFTVVELSIGNHTYELTYFDENNTKQLTKSGSFEVDYYFYTRIDEGGVYSFSKEFEMKVYVPEDATGIITISVDGKNYTATPVNGTATVILEGLVMGENNVTVSYAGDSKYPPKKLKRVMTMEGYAVLVKYDFDDYGEEYFEYVSISLPEDADGNLTLYYAQYVDGYEDEYGDWIGESWEIVDEESPLISVKLDKGFAKINASQFGFGSYHLIARYESASEEPDYAVEDDELHFNIAPEINLTWETVIGENITVSIEIPNAEGVVNVYLYDDEEDKQLLISMPSNNGTFKGEISGLPLGSYELSFEYVGEDMTNMFESCLRYVDVNPKKAEIPENFNADGSGEIALELPEGAKGTVSVYEIDEEGFIIKSIIDDAPYSSENKSIAVSGLSIGYHLIQVVYTDDEKGNFVKTADVNVPGSDAGSDISIPDTISGDALDINLSKDATGSVFVIVDGKSSMIPLVNGSAKVDLSGLSDGSHTVTVRYLGDGRYSGFEKSANMTVQRPVDVKPVDPKITASNLNILYTASTKYSVTIYGTDGKVAANTQVTFLINGKTYKTVKTNAKGIASVAITQKPGNYKITTKALGKEVTKTLKVNHIVKLQKVKVKRSAKKLVIKVTLSKVNGKYLKNKKVSLKFKGKTLKAKTNKKGVAKFTIKKNVLKKLKKGKKITYQATYLKDTVKVSVKVK